jgi:hypothetical protein
MKTINIFKATQSFVAIIFVCLSAHGQIFMNLGDSLTYEFAALPYQGTTTYEFTGGDVAFSLDSLSLSPDYAMQFDVFENNATEIPLFTGIRSSSNPFVGVDLPGAFQDLQGVVRFTMISGSATLDSFNMAVFKQLPTGGADVFFAGITPVPEPSTTTLLFAGAILTGLWCAKGKVCCVRRKCVERS